MNMLPSLPDWVPWWVPLVLLVPALLYALAFLFMPFSVLGVKTRLEVMEARLDEIQQEIRHLALRLPIGPQEVNFEDVYAPANQPRGRETSTSERPPIPPAPQDLYRNDGPLDRQDPPRRATRAAPGTPGDTAGPPGTPIGLAPVIAACQVDIQSFPSLFPSPEPSISWTGMPNRY
jgi:hypothetical protein